VSADVGMKIVDISAIRFGFVRTRRASQAELKFFSADRRLAQADRKNKRRSIRSATTTRGFIGCVEVFVGQRRSKNWFHTGFDF
jgi:hypothetical protein